MTIESVNTSMRGPVAVVEIRRGPHNYFDGPLLAELAEAIFAIDENPDARSIVLCAEGKNFCAGADLRGVSPAGIRRIYGYALSLFKGRKPIVAAVQGAAIGGGLGLALAADFRVAAQDARFTANFSRLGFHHGFGLSVTLPAVVGQQAALDLLYTGRAVTATEAREIGLCDRLGGADPRQAALTLAEEIAGAAPLSIAAIRATMRRRLVGEVCAALDAEADAQTSLLGTADFAEGISASTERRSPEFVGA